MNTISRKTLKACILLTLVGSLSACFDDDDDKIIVEPNVPPVAPDAALLTQTDTSIMGNLPASDINGDALSYEISTEPMLGQLSLMSNGSFTYTPFAEQTGSDSFVYTVSDGIAAPVSGTISITIEVLQLSFSAYSREVFNQSANDIPLSVNGREFTQDVMDQAEYQDLIDGN